LRARFRRSPMAEVCLRTSTCTCLLLPSGRAGQLRCRFALGRRLCHHYFTRFSATQFLQRHLLFARTSGWAASDDFSAANQQAHSGRAFQNRHVQIMPFKKSSQDLERYDITSPISSRCGQAPSGVMHRTSVRSFGLCSMCNHSTTATVLKLFNCAAADRVWRWASAVAVATADSVWLAWVLWAFSAASLRGGNGDR